MTKLSLFLASSLLGLACLAHGAPPGPLASSTPLAPSFPRALQESSLDSKDVGITGQFFVIAEDGVRVRVAEYLPHADPKTPLFLLFHDGGMNRAEYRYIAPRLNRMGFNCMAPDLRAGKNNLGHKNTTAIVARRSKKDGDVLAARQDMEALMVYARESYPEAAILLMGCSYSASHSLRLAGEQPVLVDGVVALSPAEIFASYGKSSTWIEEGMPNVRCPVLILSDGQEQAEWKAIYAAIPEGRKHELAPTPGTHGVRMLAEKSDGSAASWAAIEEFLQRYCPQAVPSEAAAPTTEPAPPAKQPKEKGHVSLERMVVLGASVSMGFFLPAGLGPILDESCLVEHEKVRTKTTGTFAWDSVNVAREQVEFALEANPTLLVAADFLFWLGYGAVNAQGEILTSEAERLELLETGLGMLDQFDCPIVVGDFPNMSHASGEGYMIGARQLPKPETLELLNQRLAAWAAKRGRVMVLPLKSWLRRMEAGESFCLGNYRWPAGSDTRVLQRDRLHPTLEGLAALAHSISLAMVQRGWSRPGDWELDLERVLGRFEFELKDVQRLDALAKRE